jgi:aspartate/methionine/tyrosine aminotransferase
MKIADFQTEQWMNQYEGRAIYNMTDTCVSPLTYQELLSYDTEHLLSSVKLDYGSITGDVRLKQEILHLYQSGTDNNITMAQGCLQANELVMETLLGPEDTVIAYTPSYQQFTDLPRSIGCRVITLPLYEEDQWQPHISDLKQAFQQKIRMVILNNPNNPTGTVFQQEYLNELYALAEQNNTYILCDEVYRDPSLVSISDAYEKGISTSSLSKLFSLAGLRSGWIKGPQEVIDAVNVRRDYSIISTGPLTDALSLLALQHRTELLSRSASLIQQNKDLLIDWLKDNPHFSIVLPSAGTVSFLKYHASILSTELAKGLLDQYGVFYVPGACFQCESHLRLGLTADPEKFKKGLELTAAYLNAVLQ